MQDRNAVVIASLYAVTMSALALLTLLLATEAVLTPFLEANAFCLSRLYSCSGVGIAGSAPPVHCTETSSHSRPGKLYRRQVSHVLVHAPFFQKRATTSAAQDINMVGLLRPRYLPCTRKPAHR